MVEPNGQCLDIKLRPPKIAKKSKKIYRDVFIRPLGYFNHLYQLDGLYIVSLLKEKDHIAWIDNNIDKIRTMKWIETDIYGSIPSLFEEL